MFSGVLTPGQNLQVFNTVIPLIPILVVDDFIGIELPAKVLLHNIPVLIMLHTIHFDGLILSHDIAPILKNI